MFSKLIPSERNYLLAAIGFVLLILLVGGCNLIASYNQKSYEDATMLKVESLSLIGKSSEPYADHEEAAERLKLRIRQAYEYAQGIPNNSDAARQWGILAASERNSVVGFLEFWQQNRTVSEYFRNEVKSQIAKHFDTIIELESAKIKTTAN